ncbi:MAG: protein translocase subunit SecD [Clostridia bacterium]|nr:protein translocase subunit SecD [Clostridia bacterium]
MIVALLAYIAAFGLQIGKTKIHNVLDEEHGIKRGIDLAGGSELVFEPADDAKEVTEKDLEAAQQVLSTRLTAQGYTEAVVAKHGDRRIKVEIPGEDVKNAEELLGKTAKLTFTDYEGNVVLEGEDVKGAKAEYGPISDGSSAYKVTLTFTSEGTKKFSEATARISQLGENNNIIAIVLDDSVVSSPRVSTQITESECYIEGDFTNEEAKTLASQIQGGKLPFTLKLAESRTIGATLGEKALDNSLTAAAIGMILVMLFMIIMYRMCGFMSCISLIAYISVVCLILGALRINLTLPGIAGVILTIGTAVDANVIIFERVKEELSNGKTIRASVDAGFHRAFTAILDSNVTTVIAAAVLYVFGTGTIQSFAVTLFVGTMVSMFTVILLTRFLLRQLMGFNLKNPKLYCAYKEVSKNV